MAHGDVLTEDQVRDQARDILGFGNQSEAECGVGQLTTFNQLGFKGVIDKPDGWYLPKNTTNVALVLEVKASSVKLGEKPKAELIKNIKILQNRYEKTVGILYNGIDTRVFKGLDEYSGKGSGQLQKLDYYLALYNNDHIDKEHIYSLTAKINDCLHFEFGIKNLYHRMIFTACALVAKRYDALLVDGMNYSMFTNAIQSSIGKALIRDQKQNQKLNLLLDVFSEIKMNLNVNSEDEKEQEHVKQLIGQFIGWITEISDCINSDAWRGEDVMGIFFNEFNRYKKKSEAGQIFTPEHITDFMYKILDVHASDRVLDATCGSGGFLVKAMANMINEVGGVKTEEAAIIKSSRLYGIEFDREIFALACANMLIHKDGKTNLEQMDARSSEAGEWIKSKKISKVLMNPPYENKYGCMKIVENVLNNVPARTMCGFILPDKKLEKASKTQMKRILKKNRLVKVIKLPEDLFFNVGVTTSIFVFEAGIPQDGTEFFACWMKDDGLMTVKNKGRHDVRGKWPAIEDKWVEIVRRMAGDDSCQWVNPNEHLSYQVPAKPFEISEEDFRKTAMDYLMFKNGIDTKTFGEKLQELALYSSSVSEDADDIAISIKKVSGNEQD